MAISFLEHLKEVPDHRVAGMVTYPLNEIPLATLVGGLWGADDFDAIELPSREYVTWLKQFLPDKYGSPQAQTFRKVFRLLKPDVLEQRFAAWVASMQDIVRAAVRGHWRIENNLPWHLGITFDEARCRTRKNFSRLNLAIVRHMVVNILSVCPEKKLGEIRAL